MGKSVLPTVLVQRPVFYRTHRFLPVITGIQISTFHNATTGKTEDSRMDICQSLCQVLAKSVFMSFPRIDREKRDMLQVHCSFGSKENTKCRFRLGHTRLQDQLVLLPFFRIDCQVSGGKRLMFAHRLGIHQFNPQCFFSVPLRQTCPNRETILLPFSDTDTKEAFVIQSGMFMGMSRIGKTHIMRIPFKRTVVHQSYFTVSFPSHQVLRKLKRTVLHQFGVQATVGRIVDVLKKESVHGRLDFRSQFLCLYHHFIGLRMKCHSGR